MYGLVWLTPSFHCGVALNVTSLEVSLITLHEEPLPTQPHSIPSPWFIFFMALIVIRNNFIYLGHYVENCISGAQSNAWSIKDAQ